jgi:transcriptional regulator with XRE-family HTH domain
MWDGISIIMELLDGTLEHRIASRVRSLRQELGMTLDDLSRQSGVSRAAISVIERGESSPTASILEKLAAGLGVTLASLFAEPEHPDAAPISRHADQQSWTDPESGYVRRNLSPRSYPSPLELVEVLIPPGARVAYDSSSRLSVVDQQVWVISGRIEIQDGERIWELAPGDCLAMRLENPVRFSNPGPEAARYLVALTNTQASSRKRKSQ